MTGSLALATIRSRVGSFGAAFVALFGAAALTRISTQLVWGKGGQLIS